MQMLHLFTELIVFTDDWVHDHLLALCVCVCVQAPANLFQSSAACFVFPDDHDFELATLIYTLIWLLLTTMSPLAWLDWFAASIDPFDGWLAGNPLSSWARPSTNQWQFITRAVLCVPVQV